jgi:hypothetical protein
VPSVEGLRNRHVGRTFIEGPNRADRVRMTYTPLREVHGHAPPTKAAVIPARLELRGEKRRDGR